VEVAVGSADVGEEEQLRGAIAAAGQPPLAGIVHVAGVLESALFTNLEAGALGRALHGKALGGWHLHRLSLEHPVKVFVLFSSIAGILGSPGQAAYAAANGALDGLALHRATLGLPVLNVAWGPWADARADERSETLERLAARGALALETTTAFSLLEQALAGPHPQVIAAAFDWDLWRGSGGTQSERLLLGPLAEEQGASAAQAPVARGNLRDAISSCRTRHERLRRLRLGLADQLGEVLQVPAREIDAMAPLQDIGVDSMMAIELRDRLERTLELKLSAALMWAYPTIDQLTVALLERIEHAGAPSPGGVADRSDATVEAPSEAPAVKRHEEVLTGGP
jgi:myxalamid-type polyketide synthase MxaE and MxaD